MKISRADVETAAKAFDEPLNSQVFNPWELQSVLEYIESSLKARKRGLEELQASGLAHALFGPEWNLLQSRHIYEGAKSLGLLFSRILDRVERELDPSQIEWACRVLRSWQEQLPATK